VLTGETPVVVPPDIPPVELPPDAEPVADPLPVVPAVDPSLAPVEPEELLEATEEVEAGPEVVLDVPPAVPWHARNDRPRGRRQAMIWWFMLGDCGERPNPSRIQGLFNGEYEAARDSHHRGSPLKPPPGDEE
jgi:hypothetical protein